MLTAAGQSVIDLGSYGKLIAPVQVEGAWYYFWDRSGDGTSADTGSLNGGVDTTGHDVLDGIFTSTLSEVNAGTVGTGTDTTDNVRYATLNGVKVALPTANGGVAYPQGIDQRQNGTTYTDAGASTNGSTGTFNDLLAIWDAYNGSGTGTDVGGTPSGWFNLYYWSATAAPAPVLFGDLGIAGHAVVYLSRGSVEGSPWDSAVGSRWRCCRGVTSGIGWTLEISNFCSEGRRAPALLFLGFSLSGVD